LQANLSDFIFDSGNYFRQRKLFFDKNIIFGSGKKGFVGKIVF